MNPSPDMMKALRGALAAWIAVDIERQENDAAWYATHGHKTPKRMALSGRALTRRMAASARPHLGAFARRNGHLSAEQLEELAAALSPGGAHTSAMLARIIHRNVMFVDPLLLAAAFRYNWHGGKVGFQFLPDPATTGPDDYDSEAWELLNVFDEGTGGDPRRILTGDDLAFFDSLPDSFTIYRGTHGLTAERAAAGVCWTTRREVAEWFARRGTRDRVVIMARCRKADVRMAKAAECEVVTIPSRVRQIKCRPHGKDWRPVMS